MMRFASKSFRARALCELPHPLKRTPRHRAEWYASWGFVLAWPRMRMRDESTSHPKAELVSSINRLGTPEGRTEGSVAALRRAPPGELFGESYGDGLRSSSISSMSLSCLMWLFDGAAVLLGGAFTALTLSSMACNALLKTVRHKLKRLSVNSFSIPPNKSSSESIVSSASLSAIIISKMASRMPNPALSSKRASTSSSPFPIAAELSFAEPSKTTRLAILAVSIPARRGSVNKTNDSIPSLRASNRSFLMSDAAMFNAFRAFSTVLLCTSTSDIDELSPSVLRPAMGMEASSAENEGERRLGLTIPGLDGAIIAGGRQGEGLATLLGRPIGDGMAGLAGGDIVGLARLGRLGVNGLRLPDRAITGRARPGRPSVARG
mmetsp:Transcript_26852/g.48701  ORF Transcript_26852/g.48701 Transcript_26852/m.48701 type:complete len:378 (-) Transcript_26852:1364-2497(-)